jgi:methyltransferase family protein
MIIEEVHLWRGKPSERLLRSRLVKSTQFAYFNEQLDYPDWSNKLVLDFGGNRGNLLRDPACVIAQRDYYCMDVISEAIDEGTRTFPEANWTHYARYNRSFNPQGVKDLPLPQLDVNFDFIVAYSVFTHTTLEEMKDLVAQLETRLASGGILAFTFIDHSYENNLRWRLEKTPGLDVEPLLDKAKDADWCSLINGAELFVNSNGDWTASSDDCATYNVFYTESFLQRQFPHAEIRPPVNGEMQHCAIVRKDV